MWFSFSHIHYTHKLGLGKGGEGLETIPWVKQYNRPRYVRSTFPEMTIRKYNSMGNGMQRCIILRNLYFCLPALGYVKLKPKVPQKNHGSTGLHIKKGCTQDLQAFIWSSAISLHGIHRPLQGIYKLLPLNAKRILGLDFAWQPCG